jgi:hypothetical protein
MKKKEQESLEYSVTTTSSTTSKESERKQEKQGSSHGKINILSRAASQEHASSTNTNEAKTHPQTNHPRHSDSKK